MLTHGHQIPQLFSNAGDSLLHLGVKDLQPNASLGGEAGGTADQMIRLYEWQSEIVMRKTGSSCEFQKMIKTRDQLPCVSGIANLLESGASRSLSVSLAVGQGSQAQKDSAGRSRCLWFDQFRQSQNTRSLTWFRSNPFTRKRVVVPFPNY